MFRSKKDVDRHVKDIFIKLKSPEEKNLRCYNIAKLYYHVGDYESAKKYIFNYLEVRNRCSGAYKLLGQALEALKQKEAAFMQYKISLELEPKQDDLILKVCELLTDMDVKVDMNIIKYWVERADKTFPHHPIVFELKEKMLTQEKSNDSNEDLEKLITSELSVRQTDVHLQIKLLKHYVGNHRLDDAYNHAAGIEAKHSHRNSIDWYQSLSELLLECKASKQSDWTFWIFYISVLERYAALCLKEQGNIIKNMSDATQAVFNFDQSLTEFKSRNITNHPTFIENMLLHMWGQLHFHLACLFLRKTKMGEDSWSEAGRLCAPLFLTALHVTPIDPTAVWTMHLKNRLKNQIHVWYREGSYRCSQSGHVLQDYARDNTKKLLDKIDKFCTNSWRERVYQRIFIGRLCQDGKAKSYFANSFNSNPPLRLCSYHELKRFDEISEEVWPNSLHHQIWLGLRSWPRNKKDDGPHPNQTSRVFCELQFSVFNLSQAAPDSLSRLDIDAFLNAAILCASTMIEEQRLSGFMNSEKLPTLPADLTNTLCTCVQEKWWSCAYKVYSMDKQMPLNEDLGEIRLELQRGLEAVRCIGNHGLHPALLVHLARIFHHRAEALKETDPSNGDISSLEARYEMYWSNAIPLLERLQNNQILRVTSSKFFNYQGKEMDNSDLIKALEEGKLFLAQRFVRDKQYEKAIDALQALKCPEASFQQGQVYQMLADEIVNSMPKESLTSEMRSQHIIMLSKARECFYLTLDRLRSPETNPKHPLNLQLSLHIVDIENKLKRIDLDESQGDLSKNEYDGMSDESYSSAHSAADQPNTNLALPTFTVLNTSSNMLSTPQKNTHRMPKQSSTPYRPQHQDIMDLSRTRSEARPSPERLDAQIRAINQTLHAKDSMIQSIVEHNKTILKKVEELAKEVSELRKDMQRQRAQPVNVNPNLEEDLCVLSEEDYNDLNYNANQSGPTSSISGNMFQTTHRHPYSQLVYPSTTAFQGYYPGAMSFTDPNAQPIPSLYPPNVYPMPVLYPNTRSKMPENILQQSLFTTRLPTQMPDLMPPTNQSLQILLQKAEMAKTETPIKDAPVNKIPPVNVVITTSDTLPTTAPVVQPTLSVTIPPHFRQGSISTSATMEQSVPHCYQISMPSQITIPTTVNLPPLAATLTTTPASISMNEASKADNNTNICSVGSPNSSDYEHDPIPDFVPIIPLPAEVKVTTGEEDQEVLFCGRAKLFRYVGNEWKERGVGNVKLLRNEEGKVRLLMRREQVLKVCANHYLSPNMELTAKSNNENAWVWVAQDFAEGELKLEMFCITFKTVEEGASFKEHFDRAKASLPRSPEKSVESAEKSLTKANTTTVEKKEAKSLEQQVGQKQPAETTTTSDTLLDKSKSNSTSTVIGGFSFMSTPIIQKVVTTESSKAPSKTESSSPFAGFTFNKAVTTAESSMTATAKSTVAEPTSQASTFSFAKTSAPRLEATTTSTPAVSSTVSTNVSQSSLRRPHAPAPNITSSVGIESTNATIGHEEVLVENKVSLQYYNNDTKQWENRGTGQLKALWNSKTGRIRLLMTEQNGSKVCYNYSVLSKTPFTNKDGSNVVVNWTIQYGPGNKTGMFSATFKTSAQASKFYDTITSNQQKMVKDCVPAESLKKQEKTKNVQKSKTQPSLAEMFKPPPGSWNCDACYTQNAASSVACVACKTPNPSAASKESTPTVTTTNTASNQIPLSQMFKPPPGSWKCNCCEIVNTIGNNYCVACDTPKDPSIPPKPKTDGFMTGTATSGTTPSFTFGIPQDINKKSKSGFTFRIPPSTDTSTDSKSAPDTKGDTSNTKFVFGMQQRPSTPPNKDSPFTFGSPGKSFGFNFVAKSPTKSPGGGENSEEEVVESDDIHFSPIIPLPDKIEVKTGEEDEEILYSHRAKLFRYDKSTSEWKERGLGDIKLLRHNQTGKLRLIMRREQILKLCLNHFILPTMEIKPRDEKTWIWTAADYSEGEIRHTLFACRFKNSDIANNFKKIMDDARREQDFPTGEAKTESKAETFVKSSPAQDIEVLYEAKVTPEEKEAAIKLQLPENFYAYKQKPDCSGCRGCKEPSVPLFQDQSSVTEASVSKGISSTIQFPPKIGSTSTTASNVTESVQTPVSTTNTTIPSAISFGNSDPKTSSDKKTTGFSFILPQSQPTIGEIPKPATEQNILAPENLKICSPIISQGQAEPTISSPFNSSISTTSSVSMFGTPMSDNPFNSSAGRNVLALSKSSSFNVSANNSESTLLNNINSQTKTTTIGTTIFGTTTPVFGLYSTKANPETTTSNSSPFITNTTTCLFGTSAKPTNSVFDNTSTPFSFNLSFGARTNESPFGISSPIITNISETKPATLESESQKDSDISFLPAADISFSALAAKAPQQAFKTDPNFSFSGAGSTVFGSKSTNKSAQKTKEATQGKEVENEEGECAENENEQEHDPHFEPIVPLPDVIEVRTGEEDEEKVFCERAKLYRYDSDAREWKERGVGEMKILHHAKHGTYRLLLRRDQVYKVVCNLLLTQDIKFSRLSTSDRTWIWAGMNYTEEQPSEPEKLGVKFKNPELASKFKDTIDKIQQTLSEIREKVTEDEPIIEEPEEEENEDVDEIEDEEEYEEEEDEGDNHNYLTIFEKRATLLARTSEETKWKLVAVGNFLIYYDSDNFIGSIIVKADETNEIVSNTAIYLNTEMEVCGKECIWTSIDRALEPPTRHTLKAIFSSEQDAQEMSRHFLEGVEWAKQADFGDPYDIRTYT